MTGGELHAAAANIAQVVAFMIDNKQDILTVSGSLFIWKISY